jgi:hypothetical protein
MGQCLKCRGRGGFRDGFGRWRTCSCRRAPTKQAQAVSRQIMLQGMEPEQRARAEQNWAEHDRRVRP